MRGRKPKPTRLKVLSGDTRPDRMNDREPQPKPSRGRCPSWLPKEGKRAWGRLAPMLDRLGLLTEADADALASYCLAWSEMMAATATLEAEGRTVKVPILSRTGELAGHRVVPHPAAAQQRTAWQGVCTFGARFGLSPADRVRLKVDAPGGPDPLAEFLEGQG